MTVEEKRKWEIRKNMQKDTLIECFKHLEYLVSRNKELEIFNEAIEISKRLQEMGSFKYYDPTMDKEQGEILQEMRLNHEKD